MEHTAGSQLDLGESETELEQLTASLVSSLQLYGEGDPLFCCQQAHSAVKFCGRGPLAHATRSLTKLHKAAYAL